MITVLHVTNLDAENYYLNNLVDHADRTVVRYVFATLGARSAFAQAIERRGAACHTLNWRGRIDFVRAIRGVGEIVRSDGIDVLHGHMFDPTIVAVAAAKWRGRPLVTTRHHSDAVHRVPGRLKRRAYLEIEYAINRHASHLIAPARMVRDVLVDREGTPPRKVSVIPYPQRTERFDAVTPADIARVRAECGMEGRLALVCVSRLHPEKGHTFLFQALERRLGLGLLADLFLVGEGGARGALEAEVRARGLADRVHFLGWRNDALALIAAADVVVHPALQEALPSAAIEAVMMGTPLLVANVSGIPDITADGDYAFVVPPSDVDAIARTLAAITADLPAARRRAAGGRAYLLDYMGASRVGRAYEDVYRRVVGDPTAVAGPPR